MRPRLLSLIVAAALGAGGGIAAAQEVDNNGRIIQPQVEDAPAKPAETPKPKASEKPKQKSEQPKAADSKPVEKKPADKEPAKAAAKSEAKPDRKAETKLAADPLAEVPFSERASVRAALLWSAGEDAARGEDQIAAAIAAFRKRNKSNASGVLTAHEREMLLAAAKSHDDQFGWTVVTDPATGIRLGLPAKMMPHARLAEQGTRWSSRHGDVQVETFRFKTDEPLNAVFARMKSEPANRRVEYSTARADSFIISGMQGLRKFTVRAFQRDGEVRGFTMQFDQAMEGIVAPVMTAMASAFAPFPARIAPIAALTRSVDYGTGIVASASGHILTDRKLTEGCRVIVVPGIGDAEPIATNVEHGLALLRVYGRRNLKAVTFAPAVADGNALTLVGVPDPHIQNGNARPAEIKARLSGATALEPNDPVPVAGFSGAVALDAQGRVAGMMETRTMMLASAEAAAPPMRLIPAGAIRDFLAAHHVKTAQDSGKDGSKTASDARAAVVRIICVHK